MKRAAALVLTSILLITGIFAAQSPKNPGGAVKPLAPGTIRVTPIDLFPGDLKRLQPHLEMEGACFKIEYNGPKRNFKMVTEIWEGGKSKTAGVSGVAFQGKSTVEVSISAKKASDANGQSALYIISKLVQGMSGGTLTFPKTIPKEAGHAGRQSINEVTDFGTDKEIALWCIVRTSGDIKLADPIDELAKSVDLAIVLKLVPEEDD